MMQMGLLSVCKKICINLHKFIFHGHTTSTEIPVCLCQSRVKAKERWKLHGVILIRIHLGDSCVVKKKCHVKIRDRHLIITRCAI